MKNIFAVALAALVTFAGPAAAIQASATAKDAGVRKRNGPTTIRARRSTVVVFAPRRWAAEAKTNEGTAELVAHVSFAVEDVKRCKGATSIDVRMVFADRLVLAVDGQHHDVDLSSKFPDAAGAYLLKPDGKMCVITTPKDTAFLGDLLSHAVGEFFDVQACLQQGMSDPCGGGG